MKTRFLLAALLMLPLATACQRTGGLAPVTTVGNSPDSAGGAIIVSRGDSAYTLSRRYNVPLRDLIEANHLSPPYTLEVGQRLVLPASRQYIVQKGDTLYGISRMHNVDVSELTRINGLTPPYAVQTGQPLRLPGNGGARTEGTVVADAGQAGGGAAASTGPGPVVATAPVKQVSRGSIKGEELPPPSGAPAPAAAPAPAQAPTSVAVAPVPGSKPAMGTESASGGAVYQPGQAPTSLRLPGQKPAIVAEAAPAPAPAPRAVEPPPAAPAPTQEAAAAPPPPAEEAPAPRSSGGRLLWPVKGKVISTYGPKPDGLHNDGVNIAAARGTPVVASDNGVVAYAGNELRGFGNLLLVKHSDGYITAYAHLDRIDVERGARVKRGQTIGTVGQTGSVTSPQLHFELRKGSQAVDPRDRLDSARVSEGVSPDGRQGPG